MFWLRCDDSPHVEHGATGVARVDCGRGLKELRQGHVRKIVLAGQRALIQPTLIE